MLVCMVLVVPFMSIVQLPGFVALKNISRLLAWCALFWIVSVKFTLSPGRSTAPFGLGPYWYCAEMLNRLAPGNCVIPVLAASVDSVLKVVRLASIIRAIVARFTRL